LCPSSSSALLFLIILFLPTNLLTRMTCISMHMAMSCDFPVTWQCSQREHFFRYGSNAIGYALILTKRSGYILGDFFFTNASAHSGWLKWSIINSIYSINAFRAKRCRPLTSGAQRIALALASQYSAKVKPFTWFLLKDLIYIIAINCSLWITLRCQLLRTKNILGSKSIETYWSRMNLK
jgi:hypothetical protein